jgi:hypothetical protein
MPENKDALIDGRFAADEDDDNAIDVSNPEYIGVDPEYRNHADYDEGPDHSPHQSEDEATAALEQRAKDHGQTVTGPHGYTTKTEEAGGLTAASPYSAGAQVSSEEQNTEAGEGDGNADPDADADGGTANPYA